MKKRKNSSISFEGMNAESVTGSMIHIKMENYNILLEAGLYQSNDVYGDYKINNRRFNFKPSEIDFIFLNHVHADHSLLIPRLYKEGCKATLIMPEGTRELFETMAKDSAFIMGKDAAWLSEKYESNYKPAYTEPDIEVAVAHIKEFKYYEKTVINEAITFQFVPSGHIIAAAQLELWLTEGNNTKKILYTSDLGNFELPKHYVEPFVPVEKANIVIAECTYADGTRAAASKKHREKDLEKLDTVVREVVENRARLLIPVFSLDRCQGMLTELYKLFGGDPTFKMPILVDSPLAIKVCKIYEKQLTGEDAELWNKVLHWENVKLIEEYPDSKFWQDSRLPCIVLSASGFLVRGRSREWTKKILEESKSHMLFCGFASENSLAYKIKNAKKSETLTIDKKPYRMKCKITDLKSFSSHIQHDQMLEYYSSINCEKIALVHGEFKAKLEFGKELQQAISKRNNTSKVIIVNQSTKINI